MLVISLKVERQKFKIFQNRHHKKIIKHYRSEYRGFTKYRLKNSFKKFVLNHHDVLDIKYSMEEINEFIRSHFS